MTYHDETALFLALRDRYHTLTTDFDLLHAAVRAEISHWRYALGTAFELRADYAYRYDEHEEKPGPFQSTEPGAAQVYHSYGLDAQGRIVYDATYRGETAPRSLRLYRYDGDVIECARGTLRTSVRGSLPRFSSLAMLIHHNGRPAHYVSYADDWYTVTTEHEYYHYDTLGRMVGIRTHLLNWPYRASAAEDWERYVEGMVETRRREAVAAGVPFDDDMAHMYRAMLARGSHMLPIDHWIDEMYTYDGDRLARIDAYAAADGTSRVVYEALRPGENEYALFEAARVSLRSAVLAYLRENPPDETLDVLSLEYCGSYPDALEFMFGAARQRPRSKHRTTEPRYYRFTTGDYVRMAAPMPEDCARFIRWMRRERNAGAVARLMNRVAFDLNQVDWFGILDSADDLVVIARNYDAEPDMKAVVGACLPDDKLAMLRDKGVIE